MEKKNRKKVYRGEDRLNLEFVIALNCTTNLINRKASAIFRKYGLTHMQFLVLEALYHHGDLTIGQIIEHILATGGNMTVVIHNLEKEDMITKKVSKKDSRSYLISITDKGCKIVQNVFPEFLAELKMDLGELTDKEKQLVIDLIHNLGNECN